MNWKRILILAAIIILVIILQSTLLNYIGIWGSKPDLLLIFVIAIGLTRGVQDSVIFGFAAGLLEDIAAGGMIGETAFVKMLIGLLVGLFEQRLFKENFIVPACMIFFGSLVQGLLTFFFINSFQVRLDFLSALLHKIIPAALYTSLVSAAIYPLAVRIYAKIYSEHIYSRIYRAR